MAWRILASLYVASGMGWMRHRGRVVILTYHRVVLDHMVRDEIDRAVRSHDFEVIRAFFAAAAPFFGFDELIHRNGIAPIRAEADQDAFLSNEHTLTQGTRSLLLPGTERLPQSAREPKWGTEAKHRGE